MTKKSYISDLLGLDLLRFLLSITVMITHYYFFYYQPGVPSTAQIPTQPFYSVIGLLYKWGGNVVQIFWIISGVIFQTIYYEQIAARSIEFKEFSILRLTRLYPLHFLTLFVAAVCQMLYFKAHGEFFWYQTQDFKHFFLQLFFVGSWYPYFHHSFNIPVWSVSIEMFVYIIFFLLASAGLLRGKGLYVIFGICLAMDVFDILHPFGPCLVFFFSGCILASMLMQGERILHIFLKYTVILILVAIFIGFMRVYYRNMPQHDFAIMLDVFLIPIGACTILAFILLFKRVDNKFIVNTFKSLGDLTYSTYLVHFPIQMIIVLALHATGTKPFDSPWMLFFFVGTSILTGWLVAKFFEKPVQRLLRQQFMAKKISPFAVAAVPVIAKIPDEIEEDTKNGEAV